MAVKEAFGENAVFFENPTMGGEDFTLIKLNMGLLFAGKKKLVEIF
ncbi:hypothetical protein L1999_14765 [Neobacillus drentensis]|nr:hypothetical protein [Neobacillus drentensis]ULT54436.1 hypothetical protein L1999_14765 [Neobacillus drentensis]